MLRFQVHDVGHGFCATLSGDGFFTVFDCGHSDFPENRPSKFLPRAGCTRISELVIGNFDQDHVSDLPELQGAVHVDSISRNPTIPPDALRKLKEEAGGVTHAMNHAIRLHETYTAPAPLLPHREKLEFRNFYNPYGTFSDTNNLSYVTFLHSLGFNAVLPGDLEAAGWRRLLQDDDFRAHLRRTRIFIASHHGRESGYCPEVFTICQPEVVVFSDSPIKFATQEMASAYASHATGTTFGGARRQVLSTRNDGTFWWDINV